MTLRVETEVERRGMSKKGGWNILIWYNLNQFRWVISRWQRNLRKAAPSQRRVPQPKSMGQSTANLLEWSLPNTSFSSLVSESLKLSPRSSVSGRPWMRRPRTISKNSSLKEVGQASSRMSPAPAKRGGRGRPLLLRLPRNLNKRDMNPNPHRTLKRRRKSVLRWEFSNKNLDRKVKRTQPSRDLTKEENQARRAHPTKIQIRWSWKSVTRRGLQPNKFPRVRNLERNNICLSLNITTRDWHPSTPGGLKCR